MSDHETMECDVLIVGAGPAGLSAAIHLMRQAQTRGQDAPVVMVLEKAAQVGAHILSGCVLEPRALNALLPDWRERGAPLEVEAREDRFYFLSKRGRIRLPTPPQMKNHGNYIVSLSDVTRWLGEQAEAHGVQVFPGFPAAGLIIEDKTVRGVRTGAFGLGRDGQPKDTYQPPIDIRAKITLFAEGCRGSLTRQLIQRFDLRATAQPQTYGIGIKEIWEVPAETVQEGRIEHSIGWPLQSDTYGGSFIYHMNHNRIAAGFVVGLDYANPYLDPYLEFQRFKTHPAIRPLFEGGTRIGYGARALNEGGFQSIPKLTMPGAALIGCGAGFLNVAKIKGTHTAMQSGMLAAEAALEALSEPSALTGYEEKIRNSWVYDELFKQRNIRPAFRWGLWAGLAYSALDAYVLRGHAPWTLTHHEDHTQLQPASQFQPIVYPAADGVLTFDRLSSVYLSNTNHVEDQPVHLTLKDKMIPTEVNLAQYAGPESRYCPAGVYEFVADEQGGGQRLQINAQNCVHCKTCDIKDPQQNIVWVPPEGGGGPVYTGM